MDAHVTALLQWAGPTLLSIFGILICAGLRGAGHSLKDLLTRNENEHKEFREKMLDMERRLENILIEHGERLSRVETQAEITGREIQRIKERAGVNNH